MKISKNMARIMTVLTIVLGILFSLSILTNSVYAGEATGTDGYKIPSAETLENNVDTDLGTIGGMFLTVAQIIGTAVAVVMLIVLAIKYISAAPNDKAQIKQHAVVYIVGAIVLFAASALLGLLKNFATGISVSQ